MRQKQDLMQIYTLLDDYFGDLHWWPGKTPFEVIVGAILTQNTAWRNVAIAIANLRASGILSPEGIMRAETNTLAGLIRPSGYYNIKTKRLKAFVRFLYEDFAGDLETMFAEEVFSLRAKLLAVNGIGEETADSILLYAGNKPVFVIDAYTRRILHRHGIIDPNADYGTLQALFMKNLPASIPLYNQYHALLVHACKSFCLTVPQCDRCPLQVLLSERRAPRRGSGRHGVNRQALKREDAKS